MVDAEAGHAEGYMSISKGEASHAEGSAEDKDGEWVNPTTASGFASHAEGISTKALEKAAHTEGIRTEARYYAHAEGWETKAYGDHSHAEGSTTLAEGVSSHAEGWKTQALNEGAHAQGYETVASGEASFAGGYGTIASQNFQTALGTYNEEDEDALFIVGNGDNEDIRSNAFVIDKYTTHINTNLDVQWSNGSFYLGGGGLSRLQLDAERAYFNVNDFEWNGKQIATEEYVDDKTKLFEATEEGDGAYLKITTPGGPHNYLKLNSFIVQLNASNRVELNARDVWVNGSEVATQNYVQQLINESLGVIENGTY